MSVVREELHRQANYLQTLESTNAKLTSELIALGERRNECGGFERAETWFGKECMCLRSRRLADENVKIGIYFNSVR